MCESPRNSLQVESHEAVLWEPEDGREVSKGSSSSKHPCPKISLNWSLPHMPKGNLQPKAGAKRKQEVKRVFSELAASCTEPGSGSKDSRKFEGTLVTPRGKAPLQQVRDA